MQPATSGEMFFKGKPHKPATMIEGTEAGIGMIVQEMGTVEGRSIAENIRHVARKNSFQPVQLLKRKK